MPFISNESCERLLTVLAHSLWQATAIGVLVGAGLRIFPAKRAETRYGIALGGLLSVVLAIFITWSVLGLSATRESGPIEMPTAATVPLVDGARNSAEQARPVVAVARTESRAAEHASSSSLQALLVGVWLSGAVLMLMRGTREIVAVRSWLRECDKECDISSILGVVRELAERLGVRRAVRVVVSARVAAPAVCGAFWPVILIPTAMLTGIPAEQWRVIIAHELAHVRRWDALVSLGQLIVESLLFFNPAVWWLSQQVRIEREACCDALAARVLGQPLSVARTLVDVAQTLVESATSTSRLALPFAEPTPEGELTDRVQRLVDPDRTPQSRLTWIGIGVVLLSLLLTATLLQRGTDIAVRVAAEWMTPKQRVDRIVELEAERNSRFIEIDEARKNSPDGSGEVAEIEVEVVVRTEDGSPITPQLQVSSMSAVARHSSSRSLSGPREAVPEFRQLVKLPPGRFRVAATQPNWASVCSPTETLLPGAEKKVLELVLTKGRDVEFEARDERGSLLPSASIEMGLTLKLGGGTTGYRVERQQADSTGRLRLKHVGPNDYSLTVTVPGHQPLRREWSGVQSADDKQPIVLTMKAARPTPLRIIDAATEQPVANARLRAESKRGKHWTNHHGSDRNNLQRNGVLDFATTDEQGLVTLKELEDEVRVACLVIAPGYALQRVVVEPGQPMRTIRLQPPIVFSGRVTGSLQRLQSLTYRKAASPSGPYRIGGTVVAKENGESFEDHVILNVEPDGAFELTAIVPGERLQLQLPDETKTFDLKSSLTDVVIDIPSERTAPATKPLLREVVLRLSGTQPEAPARGALALSASSPKSNDLETQKVMSALNEPQAVRDNEVRVMAPIGIQLFYRDESLAGYSIKEGGPIEVAAATVPLVVDVPVTQAGALHGTVTRADGTPANSAFVSAFATKLPSTEKDHGRINPSLLSGQSQYLRKVPLGGRYCLLARERTSSGEVWVMSDEFTVDASNPIHEVNLKLPEGRPYSIALIDAAGKPVSGQNVKLEIGFGIGNGTKRYDGFSFEIEAASDASGVANFGRLSLDQRIDPAALTLHAKVAPGPLRATSIPVSISKPTSIRLQRGFSARGQLLDVRTGQPIANAKLSVYPQDYGRAEYKSWVPTTTDSAGRFSFEGLEPIVYRGNVERAEFDPKVELLLDPQKKSEPIWRVRMREQ